MLLAIILFHAHNSLFFFAFLTGIFSTENLTFDSFDLATLGGIRAQIEQYARMMIMMMNLISIKFHKIYIYQTQYTNDTESSNK